MSGIHSGLSLQKNSPFGGTFSGSSKLPHVTYRNLSAAASWSGASWSATSNQHQPFQDGTKSHAVFADVCAAVVAELSDDAVILLIELRLARLVFERVERHLVSGLAVTSLEPPCPGRALPWLSVRSWCRTLSGSSCSGTAWSGHHRPSLS